MGLTPHILQQPNWLGQPFWLNVIFLSADLTLHCVKYSLDFSAERHISFYFNLWLMSFYFISFLATCSLDHPFLLLPDLWLCSQHVGCHQCTRLSQHNSGLPPPAGKSLDVHKPLGALGGKRLCKVHCLSCISSQQFPVDCLCSPWKVLSVLASPYSTSLQGYITNSLQDLCRALEFYSVVEALSTTSFGMKLILQDTGNK